MTRQLRVVGLFLVLSLAMVYSARAQNPPATAPPQAVTSQTPPQQVMAQTTNIPYFTLRDGMSSVLTVNNVGAASTPVTITIYSMQGKAILLEPITLDPHSYKQIDLSTVAPGDEFTAGNIQIAYTATMMGVTCQVSVTSLDKRVSFESREPYETQDMQDMMPMMSNKLGGVLSLPTLGAEGFLALTNSSTSQSTVQISVGSKQKSYTLNPRQTNLLHLSDEFGVSGPSAALLTLQYSGLPGDIITTGFVLDLKDGFSSAFVLVDPSLDVSSHLSGAHLRIGEADPSEGFPVGTSFRSPLNLANRGNNPITAHVLLDYKINRKLEMTPADPSKTEVTGEQFGTLAVGDVIVPPGGVKKIELSDFVAKLGGGPVVEAGVDIDYKGAPGTLIGQLVSVDQTGDYSFEVPIKDPAALTEGMDGIYPWTLDAGTNTVVHLKNTTSTPVLAYMTLGYYDANGFNTYRHPKISLRPYETVAIDIQELKDSKEPDLLGHALPTTATYGQAVWHQVTPYSMIGRAEQTNVKEGIARSFSCNQNCCDNYSTTEYFSPSSVTALVGSGVNIYSYEEGITCSGYPFGPELDGDTQDWTSTNSSVGTTTSCTTTDDCDVSLVGGGNTTIEGDAHYSYYQDSRPCFCQVYGGFLDPSAQVTVQQPTYLNVYQVDTNTYTGQDENECGSIHTPVVWGHSLCVHYQLQDQSGNNITIGSFTASETLTVESSNPSGQTFTPFSNVPLVEGTVADFLIYATDASPGVPAGTYAHVQQSITVKNTATGTTYNVRTNCNDYESTGITVTDITKGGSCT